jgi:hypothetical protein
VGKVGDLLGVRVVGEVGVFVGPDVVGVLVGVNVGAKVVGSLVGETEGVQEGR